jgi:integrase
MAYGIVKRHSVGCPAREGKRCRCKVGYQAWVYLEREGKKIYKTFAREAEAKSWRADALAAADKGALRPARRDVRTLAVALREFVDGMREGIVRPKNRERYKPATVRGYDQHLRRRIGPSELGSLKVKDVQRSDVQGLVDELLADGLSIATVNNILNPIQAFYGRAQDRGEVAHNPTERIDIPGTGSGRPKRIASGEEAAELLAPLRCEDQPIWATAFYAGLRRGELQALRVCDIDLKASLIRVEHSWDQYEGPIPPKSEAGRRAVPLLAVLRRFLDGQLKRTGRSGEDLLFGRNAEAPFVSSILDNQAQECWEAVGLSAITLHECRHTFASLLIDAGANPKAVQTFMGHSKIQTTFDIYGHLLPGSHDEVRERMDAYLGEPPPDADA